MISLRRAVLPLALALAGCSGDQAVTPVDGADKDGFSAPSAITTGTQKTVADEIAPLRSEGDDGLPPEVMQGVVALAPELRIVDDAGAPRWDITAYDFMSGDAPDSVNPSLWRQAKINNIAGLFKVTEGVWQLRGFDLANMTMIEGQTGWIVVDPLTNAETARAALDFAAAHLPERPVVAVLFTHSHIDHFGGVFGVTTPEAVADGSVQVIAPQGFMEEATSEMVLAGRVMSRRADFMYGRRLPRSERGHVGSGLGKAPAIGTISIAEPSTVIDATPYPMTIDGVDFVFQNVPGSEAPAEFTFYLPDLRAFCGAELVSRTLHNLYTLRGAKVRDALKWSGYIDEALRLFPDTDVIFNSHHWPVFGNRQAVDYLKQQRDTYKYIHDQTLRLAGAGLTPDEIAETIELPDALRTAFHNRDYYGTLKHNARAVYQFYFGWYDGNPANLNPLPSVDSAARYVDLMGGSEAVLAAAASARDEGNYRWAAELLNHLVLADPEDPEARSALAQVYDQLGYQSESGPWRDVYLSGAYELRYGAPEAGSEVGDVAGLLRATPIERVLELMAAMLDGPGADGLEMTINFNLTDLGDNYVLTLENGVLHQRLAQIDETADVTLNLTQNLLVRILTQKSSLSELITGDELSVEGSRIDLVRFLSLLKPHSGTFNIVTP